MSHLSVLFAENDCSLVHEVEVLYLVFYVVPLGGVWGSILHPPPVLGSVSE